MTIANEGGLDTQGSDRPSPTPTWQTNDRDALRARLAALPIGPWRYRPHAFDDWGLVRDGLDQPLLSVRASRTRFSEADLNVHRVAKTDPVEDVASFCAAAPDLVVDLLDQIDALTARLSSYEASDNAEDASTPPLGARVGLWTTIALVCLAWVGVLGWIAQHIGVDGFRKLAIAIVGVSLCFVACHAVWTNISAGRALAKMRRDHRDAD